MLLTGMQVPAPHTFCIHSTGVRQYLIIMQASIVPAFAFLLFTPAVTSYLKVPSRAMQHRPVRVPTAFPGASCPLYCKLCVSALGCADVAALL